MRLHISGENVAKAPLNVSALELNFSPQLKFDCYRVLLAVAVLEELS